MLSNAFLSEDTYVMLAAFSRQQLPARCGLLLRQQNFTGQALQDFFFDRGWTVVGSLMIVSPATPWRLMT